MMRFLLLVVLATAGLGGGAPDLFSGFETGWGAAWTEHALAAKANVFRLEEDEGNRFLRVDSMSSASALWRKLDHSVDEETRLSWRWRVTMSLDHIDDERRRGSDDYAARVAVMFDGEAFDRKTRALMYVWSGQQRVGSVYPSPYTKNVATIVVRSGDGRTGEWLSERRDVRADYERFFGEPPGRVTAVALMVDTDNTRSEATAWFDDLVLGSSAGASKY